MGVDLSGGLPAVPERDSGPIQAIEDALNAANGVGQKFAEGVVGLFDMIRDAFTGTYTGDIEALEEIQDGQLGILARLDDVSGYAVAYMKENRYKDRRNWNRLEFNGAVIQNPKNAEYIDNGIQLAEGTWFLDAQLTHDQHADRDTTRIRIEVTRPDGSVFSRKDSYGEVFPQPNSSYNKFTTLSVRHSVSLPGPGYQVHVWAYYSVGSFIGNYPRLLYRGGTSLTHLMVDRINLDPTESAVDEDGLPTIGSEEGDDG